MNKKVIRLIWLGLQSRYPTLKKVRLRFSKEMEPGQRGYFEFPPKPCIVLRRSLVKIKLKEAITTLLHEAAHALCVDSEQIHHGASWRKWALRLGVPKREVEWHCRHDHKGEFWNDED